MFNQLPWSFPIRKDPAAAWSCCNATSPFLFCFVNFDDILKPSHAGLDPFIIGFELQDEPYLKACEFSGGNVQDLKINQIE